MIDRKQVFWLVLIVAALASACAGGEPAEEPQEPPPPKIPVRIETPGPIVDLDPEPGDPGRFAWYYTPPPGQPGFPEKSKLGHSGSVFDTMNEENECEFRADFIGGKEVSTFNVWDENQDKMDDASKVLLESLGADKKVKIVVTIEWDKPNDRLNWVIDDVTDDRDPCTMVPTGSFAIDVAPVELQGLQRATFKEISGVARVATDFKFWVKYEE
jgi:hypothetical protein